MDTIYLESKGVSFVLVWFAFFIEGTEFDLAYHHFTLPPAELHHYFLAD